MRRDAHRGVKDLLAAPVLARPGCRAKSLCAGQHALHDHGQVIGEVMAPICRPRDHRHGALFLAVSAVRRQLATADGLIGYTLRAKPLARDYWTLSVWEDDAALRAFMRTAPHVQLMTSVKPFMGPTRFVTWTATAADGRPGMAAALDHLAAG